MRIWKSNKASDLGKILQLIEHRDRGGNVCFRDFTAEFI